MHCHDPIQCIVPPHILREIAEKGTTRQQQWAKRTLLSSEQFRGQRLAMAETTKLVARQGSHEQCGA